MTFLVIESFLLMLISVAIGMAIGYAARELATAYASRQPLAAAGVPAGPAEEEAQLEATTATVEDEIIDPDRAAAADQVGVRPAPLAGPRDGRPDDLKRIRGIGPQSEARLHAIGIFHLDQIADWTADEARWVGAYLAFTGRIERQDWIGQAQALTTGPEPS
jgi:predicted flap endonuclease-1-like 5' DNA nuclease